MLLKRVLLLLIVVFIVMLGLLATGSQFYTDWLWFDSLDLQQVFWTMLLWERAVPAAVWLLFAVFFFVNLRLAKNAAMQLLWRNPQLAQMVKPVHVNGIFIGASVALGFLFAAGTSLFAFQAAKFFHAVPFGINDPIFGRDVGFYMFELPFYQFILNLGIAFVVPAVLVCAAIYGSSGHIQLRGFEVAGSKHALLHVSILAALFVLLRAVGYYFDVFDLMFASGGAVYGPGYTDVQIRIWVLRILAGIAVLSGLVLLVGGRKRITRFAVVVGVWFLFSILGGGIVPGLVQSWMVEPNEFSREEPYIAYHIDMTRQAFGLDSFQTREFSGSQELNWNLIEDHWATIENIRLWDPRPLLLTYGQLQEMRLYYRFLDADIGRYTINGEYRQVLLAARELDVTRIQNRTWINEHLQYTHGYGAVMSPVNEASRQGLPEFWISDIPPRSRIDLTIDVPQIYFGERTNQYVIVNTRADEFDYPMGDQNAFYRYTGDDGVVINSLLRRAAYALRFGTSRILLSSEISSESRVLYNRNIQQRVRNIAPFLRFDNDPYLVVNDGRLYWIMDAYTTSDRFPYSQPYRGWGNYVRNSVKVVIDAYHGTVDFYQVQQDPLLETYASIFPDLFKDWNDMDPGLQEHIRYPEDLLTIQAQMYGTYHMQNTRVFYNREDVWTFANEVYSNREQPVVPYYVITQLPGKDRQEMILMLPFTPISRANMVAWLAARSDAPHYGEVFVYSFPKDTLTLGPAQIEARIDQDSEISQLLSLWGQRGSQVIRGNLLVLPIADGLLYVEPLYLQSEQSGMPQLQRVIVAHGDDLVMAETLEMALWELFEGDIPEDLVDRTDIESDVVREPLRLDVADLPLRAQELYEEASEALRRGDFAGFGDAWYELEQVLMQWTESMQ